MEKKNNYDLILRAFELCEGVLQQYICYVSESKLDKIFGKDIIDGCFEHKDANGMPIYMTLGIVPKDYVFPLERVEETKIQNVRELMTFLTRTVPIVYKLMLGQIENSDVGKPEYIEGSKLVIDPANTTFLAYNERYAEHLKNIEKRIGFIWITNKPD